MRPDATFSYKIHHFSAKCNICSTRSSILSYKSTFSCRAGPLAAVQRAVERDPCVVAVVLDLSVCIPITIFHTKFIIFSIKFIIFNTKFIVLNPKSIDFSANRYPDREALYGVLFRGTRLQADSIPGVTQG